MHEPVPQVDPQVDLTSLKARDQRIREQFGCLCEHDHHRDTDYRHWICVRSYEAYVAPPAPWVVGRCLLAGGREQPSFVACVQAQCLNNANDVARLHGVASLGSLALVSLAGFNISGGATGRSQVWPNAVPCDQLSEAVGQMGMEGMAACDSPLEPMPAEMLREADRLARLVDPLDRVAQQAFVYLGRALLMSEWHTESLLNLYKAVEPIRNTIAASISAEQSAPWSSLSRQQKRDAVDAAVIARLGLGNDEGDDLREFIAARDTVLAHVTDFGFHWVDDVAPEWDWALQTARRCITAYVERGPFRASMPAAVLP